MIIGKAVTVGGSGISCILTIITAPTANVTATLNNTTVSTTANNSGVATIEVKREGTWIVTSTYLGKSESAEIVVDHNINVVLELTNKLYIYKPGYAGWENAELETKEFTIVETFGDSYVEVRNIFGTNSSYDYYRLRLLVNVAEYTKLVCKVKKIPYTTNTVPINNTKIGWALDNSSGDSSPKETVSKDITTYEFDISDIVDKNIDVIFQLGNSCSICVYEMYLDK